MNTSLKKIKEEIETLVENSSSEEAIEILDDIKLFCSCWRDSICIDIENENEQD